jgi:predicted dehydrogenase
VTRYTAAIIGAGPDPENPNYGESAAMGYAHAEGYRRHDDVELIAVADLVEENARAFANEYDIGDEWIFEDLTEMLEEAKPDFVSVATPVPTHAPIVLDCLRTGVPDAIHCEKPMATTWGDCRLMTQEAARRDVQLTFNHQRRFSHPWRTAKDVLDSGRIGDLDRVEIATKELLDNGTHYLDLANFYNDETPPEWVLGAIDYREEHVKYGAHNENQSLVRWQYANGVDGVGYTGLGQDIIPGTNRLVGTEGVIEVGVGSDGFDLDVRTDGDDWETIDGEPPEHYVAPAIAHIVESLDAGVEPELSARRALNATEIIFATYESARKRGRVDLPLTIDDNPLEDMVETGVLDPAAPDTE